MARAKRHKPTLMDSVRLARDRAFGPRKEPKVVSFTGPKMRSVWGLQFPVDRRITNLRFLHVGKCGGTTIHTNLFAQGVQIDSDHMRPPASVPGWVFVWVRHPMRRFVSAFNHSKGIVEFDLSGLDPDNLTLNNCPAPQKIRNRILTGHAFDPRYETLLDRFDSANAVAESLTSGDPALREQAQELFAHPSEHMARGFGHHLHNGAWVEKNHRRIFFTGCLETIKSDYAELIARLGLSEQESAPPAHRRSSSKTYEKGLSQRAQQNLANAFVNTEYPALRSLNRYGHLNEERLEEYLSFVR